MNAVAATLRATLRLQGSLLFWLFYGFLLALAIAQCLSGVAERGRVRCILGATADGSNEIDDALFVASVCREIDGLDVPAPVRERACALVEEALGV